MLKYSQSSGLLVHPSGLILARCWSGNHAGKNNPAMQDVPCVGPLPRGFYTICEWEEQHGHLGKLVAFLRPDKENEMFGRGDFFIHGTSMNPLNYGQESKGCIVTPRSDRLRIQSSKETRVEVVL